VGADTSKLGGGTSTPEPESQVQAVSARSTAQEPPWAAGVVPAAKRGAIYTMTAREGLDAAELVNAAFGRKTIGKLTPRKLEVVAPDGPSTAGGKRARQTIRLTPVSGEAGTVMCGALEVAQKVVELRTYATLAQQYQARFGEPCDITAEEYTALCRDLQMTLTPFRYSFQYEPEAEALAVPRAGSSQTERDTSKPPLLKPVLLSVLVVVAACAALALLR
jgi:hypothetical protein